MARPNLTIEDVQRLLPEVTDIHFVDECGQKQVFSGIFEGKKYAYKFMGIEDVDRDGFVDDTTIARARREVETMIQCDCPYLVKIGLLGLKTHEINDTKIIFYDEEFVQGQNLKDYLKNQGTLTNELLIKLAYDISYAIDTLWNFAKIHRDIKPSNIIFQEETRSFILLDMGLVFDLGGESLSIGEVGTPLYFSPEQTDFMNRRSGLDFRSDLFSLGIVLYEMATGVHPFREEARTRSEVLSNILNNKPVPPRQRISDVNQVLNDIIIRLLAKRPALRYRSIDLFHKALEQAKKLVSE
jgi:serine/threonine protein kinase